MIKFCDEFSQIRGEFCMKVYRRGVLIEEYEDRNLIVNGARTAVAKLVAGDGVGKNISKIAFGTNGAAASPDNTAITGAYSKVLQSYSFPLAGQVLFKWNLTVGEANGLSINEFGLLCADGTLFARKTRSNPLPKESDISLEGEWLIIF